MPFLSQLHFSLSFRLLVISAVCIVLMIMDHRYTALQGVRSSIGSYLVYPLQYIVATPGRVVDWSTENLTTRKSLIEQNTQLKDQNLKLMARQQHLAQLLQENARLRELLRASTQVGEDVLVAEIVRVDQDYYTQQIVINKGEAHNVYLSQPVIDAMGVMGQVIETTKYSATVLLITDAGHALPVRINRNSIRSILKGKGDPNEMDLMHIPNTADIKVDDLLITSGLGGVFPANYPAAIVTEVIVNPGKQFAVVKARPTAYIDRSSEVLLVWPNKDDD